MARLRDLVDAAATRLVTAGVPAAEARLDAELLMRDVLAWDRATWIAERDQPATGEAPSRFAAAIERRAGREPVAYIRGVQEFYGRDFQVRQGVLIPRPETELLVEEALAAVAGAPAARIVDIGTGSGCLAVTLALECPQASIAATDISAAALAVAHANAAAHGVTGRISFVETSLLDGIDGTFDLIIANPPYVPERDAPGLAPEVLAHEPHMALFSGPDGLREVRAIVGLTGARLAPGGSLVMEIGVGQWPEVRAALADAGLSTQARVRQDLQGIARAVVATRS